MVTSNAAPAGVTPGEGERAPFDSPTLDDGSKDRPARWDVADAVPPALRRVERWAEPMRRAS